MALSTGAHGRVLLLGTHCAGSTPPAPPPAPSLAEADRNPTGDHLPLSRVSPSRSSHSESSGGNSLRGPVQTWQLTPTELPSRGHLISQGQPAIGPPAQKLIRPRGDAAPGATSSEAGSCLPDRAGRADLPPHRLGHSGHGPPRAPAAVLPMPPWGRGHPSHRRTRGGPAARHIP